MSENGKEITDFSYIHPYSDGIRALVEKLGADSAEGFLKKLLAWFDENIAYSRLDSPFYPLQRSDLDLLNMRCGTCGDFSNLIVSCLTAVGVPADYAFVKTDCYGDPQDHICAAALIGGRRVLIDATLPYRKWFGYDCPHRETELVAPEEFERRLRATEAEYRAIAEDWGKPEYAGLLYAPWIHDEIVRQTEDCIETVFYLLSMSGPGDWELSATYMAYTQERGRTPVMGAVSGGGTCYRFSVREKASIWDPEQWSEPLAEERIPPELLSPEFELLKADMKKNVPRILRAAGLKEEQDTLPDR